MWLEDQDIDELVQIGGLIRFSCPFENSGYGGYKWRFGTLDEELATLFSEERMEERFRYFENTCLHTLKKQTAKNFTIGIMIGENMPAKYRERIENDLADFPQAKLLPMPIQPYKASIKQSFEQIFDKDTPLRLSFRLDDDDAVALDFIEEVTAKLPQMIALSGAIDPIALSFLKKFTLFGPEGAREISAKVDGNPLGLGLCVLAPAGNDVDAYTQIHFRIQMHMQTIMDMRPMMNLRSFHTSNDSEMSKKGGRDLGYNEEKIREVLKKRFDLDMDELLAL